MRHCLAPTIVLEHLALARCCRRYDNDHSDAEKLEKLDKKDSSVH
jgi:hypothetical protein